MLKQAFVGLGSNLKNPQQQVKDAIVELAAIDECCLIAHSPWYQSTAVGPGEQPDYINGVALIETSLEAHALLDHLQTIERAHQRERIEHWGARTLDLDLLLFGDEHIETHRLTVPHAFLTQRNFVLYPLSDLAPQKILPCGTSIASLLATSPTTGLVKISQ